VTRALLFHIFSISLQELNYPRLFSSPLSCTAMFCLVSPSAIARGAIFACATITGSNSSALCSKKGKRATEVTKTGLIS
jgi:hypothetical protein